MSLSKSASLVSLSLLALVGCGDPPPAVSPEAPPAPAASAPAETPAPVASAAVDAGPPALKGSFGSFGRAANSGKVDKVGEKDGVFKADGVKDLVFEGEFEGPAAAFFIASVDSTGAPNGDFDADTLTGTQSFPTELSRALNAGGYTAGIGIYEGDKLLNGPDGAIAPLADGKHKLTFYVSAKTAPKDAVRVYAMLTDKTVVTGPVAEAPAGKAGAAKAAPAAAAAKK